MADRESPNRSLPAAKRRFRTALSKIERLEGELRELLAELPAPTREDFEAMLKHQAPIRRTQEELLPR